MQNIIPMDLIDVSIIIPVYNVEAYIAECLQSVMSQNVACMMECIIVDDCGADNSMKIAQDLISEYNGPIVFKILTRENNGGLSAARNSGIKIARGKYIYLLDSDDVITADCIGSLLKRANEYPSAQIITGDFQTFPKKDVHKWMSLQDKNFPEFSDDISWIRSIFLNKFVVTSWNKLILRNFILDNNLFFKEGVIHEDNHWNAQTYHYIQALAFVDKVTYYYRMREGSITSNPNSVVIKLQNLCIIYSDMFSRFVKWDKSWTDWVINCLCEFKYSPIYKDIRPQALEICMDLLRVIRGNSSVPIPLRILFQYWNVRPHRGQNWLFFRLYNLYWRLI